MKEHQLKVTPVWRDEIDFDALVAALMRITQLITEADEAVAAAKAEDEESAA